MLAAALIAGGVMVRDATPDRAPFVDVVLEKTQPYLRELVEKVSY